MLLSCNCNASRGFTTAGMFLEGQPQINVMFVLSVSISFLNLFQNFFHVETISVFRSYYYYTEVKQVIGKHK